MPSGTYADYLYCEDGVLYRRDYNGRKSIHCYLPGRLGESFEVPADVYIVGSCAFLGNKHVRHITLPEGVKWATDMNEFLSGMSSTVQSITLPSTIERVGQLWDDFRPAPLVVVCKAATPPEFWDRPNRNEGATLLVPAASVAAYKADANWGAAFGKIVAMADTTRVVSGSDPKTEYPGF